MIKRLKNSARDLYDSTMIKAKVACGLAKDMYGTVEDKINKTAREHPTLVKIAPFAPIIAYVGINALDAASDLVLSSAMAENITGDDGLGIRDGLIKILNPNSAAGDLKIYGIDDNGEMVRINHGVHESNGGIWTYIRNFLSDPFSKYLVVDGDNSWTVTDEQLMKGNGVVSIGGSGGGSGDGGLGAQYIWGIVTGVVVAGITGLLIKTSAKKKKEVEKSLKKLDDFDVPEDYMYDAKLDEGDDPDPFGLTDPREPGLGGGV